MKTMRLVGNAHDRRVQWRRIKRENPKATRTSPFIRKTVLGIPTNVYDAEKPRTIVSLV